MIPTYRHPVSASNSRKSLQFFLMVLSLMISPVLSQAQSGIDMYDAIPAGSFSSCASTPYYISGNNYYYNGTYYSDNFNEDFNSSYYLGQYSPDVWYTFTVGDYADMTFSLCGSSFDTYIHVIDEQGNVVSENDDDYTECGSATSYLSLSGLGPGTYYVVVEGYGTYTGDYNLEISSQISGTALAGANMSTAINAGTFNSSGNYSNSMSNTNPCLGNDYGEPSTDIYYKFTLSASATVKLSHCGSYIDTYMWLLDNNGGYITHNDDGGSGSPCPGIRSYIEIYLAAGTYYVVSEGSGSSDGSIVTTIQINPSPSVTIVYPSSAQTFKVGTAVAPLVPAISNAPVFDRQITTTYAGSGSQGSADGSASSATFNWPLAAAVDGSGNLYVADSRNQRIRKISPSGTVSTLAGSGSAGYADGTGAGASFRNPAGLAVDASGNVYVADQQNNAVRKITPAGVVTTVAGNGTSGFADGTGTAARFSGPAGICIDAVGNLYIGDSGNNRIRKITPTGVVSTYAGSGSVGAVNGPATSASFRDPRGLVIDASGNLIVCDRQNYLIRRISSSGTVSTLAGSGVQGWVDGSATTARFGGGHGISIDESGNIYVVDQGGNTMIRKIAPDGTVSTFAGSNTTGSTDGTGSEVRFNTPYGICSGPDGILYVADTYNNKIRKMVTRPFSITPSLPAGLAFNYSNGSISGTPAALSAFTVYTIRGYNASTTVNIAVIGDCLELSADQNYIVSYSPREEGMIAEASVISNSCDPYKVQTTVQYFDGLGRISQTVNARGNHDATKDLVVPTEYDEFGREVKKYLPYTSPIANGSYKTNAFTAQTEFYNPAGSSGTQQSNGVIRSIMPYTQTVFEGSPLHRVLEQGAPGVDWQPAANSAAGHTVKMGYSSNAANEVKLWTVTATGATGTAGYSANELYKSVSKDENWKETDLKAGTTEEFRDKEGRVVLKRVWEDNIYALSTYYIYDNFGNLNYVVPPVLNDTHPGKTDITSFTESDASFSNFIYGYHYDGKNRLVEKKIPGKGWEYMIYNKLDQVVFTQDANQRSHNGQNFMLMKYDALGRLLMTLYSDGIPNTYAGQSYRSVVQQSVDAQTSEWEERDGNGARGYTERTYGQGVGTTLSINYYDDYDIPGLPVAYDQRSSYSTMTRGLLTATRTKVLNGTAGTADMLWTVNYYDDRGRVAKTIRQQYLGGTVNEANYDEITNEWNFDNSLKNTLRVHHVGTASTTIANAYTYDHMGRRTQTMESINGASPPIIISELGYNEIGQLKEKSVGDNLNTTGYTYNERGWLKGQTNTDASFGETMKYNDAETGTTAQYNGNIANQVYTNGSAGNTFNYSYDKLNRLTKGEVSPTVMSEVLTYDVMGNITSLNRDNGGANIYTYKNSNGSNQLQSVAGVTLGDYQYDANGNATVDGRNGKTIGYNVQNLPQTVSGGLSYIYDATGRKLRKTANGQTRDYVDGIEYRGDTIDIIHTEEGIARNSAGSYSYEYNLTDHLGNVRATFYKNPNSGNLEVLQRDDYYAFGKTQSVPIGGGGISVENKYLYNGKEIQDELGGQYDYGARFYDPVIGRWNVVDPLADVDRRWSPYSYGHNNPIRNIDVDGLFVKPGDLFKTVDAAAKDFGKFYNGKSIMLNKEYNSSIYKIEKDGKTFYSYTPSSEDGHEFGSTPTIAPDKETVAFAHSHSAYNIDSDNDFSPKDIKNRLEDGKTAYVSTPNGSLKKFDPSTNKKETISTDLPSDRNDPNRKNDVMPLTGKSAKETYLELKKTEDISIKQDKTKVL